MLRFEMEVKYQILLGNWKIKKYGQQYNYFFKSTKSKYCFLTKSYSF